MTYDEIFNGRENGVVGCVCGARFRTVSEVVVHCLYATEDDEILFSDEPLAHRLKRGDWNTERAIEQSDEYSNKLAVLKGFTQ